jgi:hypothetical protein
VPAQKSKTANLTLPRSKCHPKFLKLSCSFQKETFVCGQKETGLKDWAMEEDGGFSLRIWSLTEVIDIAIWT